MTDHIPVVETDRLRLRAPHLDDLPTLTGFYGSERSHWVGGPLDARAAHRSMLSVIGSWALRGYGLWYVADKDSDGFLGWAGIIFAPGWHEPELGWTVMEEAEGKGIAFEAVSTARNYAARHLGQDGVISYIDPENTRSAALASRLGATLEREDTFLDHPVHIYRHPKEAA
ncbi:GNAT family N-acetyltransferase [Sulfitobacter sp. JB4-11]|uniref:GNAT family N-acetyltransferase n=1 Tax=Sulfitobacter rhodophyticola TaxID=3238304 RepID=UPI00351224E0